MVSYRQEGGRWYSSALGIGTCFDIEILHEVFIIIKLDHTRSKQGCPGPKSAINLDHTRKHANLS